jgi:hypothetical protein
MSLSEQDRTLGISDQTVWRYLKQGPKPPNPRGTAVADSGSQRHLHKSIGENALLRLDT